MDAELVCPPRQWRERKPSQIASQITGTAAHHPPCSHRWLALGVVLHPPAAGHIETTEREFDPALIRVRCPLDHGPIGLLDQAALEQLAELGQRLAVAAEHQAA